MIARGPNRRLVADAAISSQEPILFEKVGLRTRLWLPSVSGVVLSFGQSPVEPPCGVYENFFNSIRPNLLRRFRPLAAVHWSVGLLQLQPVKRTLTSGGLPRSLLKKLTVDSFGEPQKRGHTVEDEPGLLHLHKVRIVVRKRLIVANGVHRLKYAD